MIDKTMKNSIQKARQGITITEALASIAVAAVGLFAVLAVIPFAARQTEAGLNLDVSVTVGKNAFQEFDVRGMGNVNNWRLPNISGTRDLDPPADTIWAGKAFVIDPLYLTRNDVLVHPAISVFPYTLYHGDETPANRVSPPDPRAASEDQCLYGIDRLNLASSNTPFNFAQAERIFQSINELVFEEPEDKLNPANQQFKLVDPSLGDNPRNQTNWLRRYSAGKVSWLAMVVPETSVPGEANPHMYRLYVVVFRDRQVNYRLNGSTGEAVFTGQLQGNGDSGGVVDLTLVDNAALPLVSDPPSTAPTAATNLNNALIQDDYLNAGDWVLLTDYNQVDEVGDLNAHGKNWRWYQVQRVDPNSPTQQRNQVAAGSPIRTTLIGPDWTGRDIDLTNESDPVATQNDPRNADFWDVRAIVLSNVIAVYEKTIRIEYESIWND